MAKYDIKNIKAREILDSRGNPTVEVDLETGFGVFRDSVPSGASKGKDEALELRDGGERYDGKGVLKAIENIEKIINPALIGKDSRKQKEIDKIMQKLDGTSNKSKLGANAILAVSMAVCRAGAVSEKLPLAVHISKLAETRSRLASFFSQKTKLFLPSPSILMIEGGMHAGNELDFQEFMLLPFDSSYKEKLRKGTEIYHELEKVLKSDFGESATNVGYEGGYTVPSFSQTREALDIIKKAIAASGSESQAKISLDCAASTFYENKFYRVDGKNFSKQELLDFYSKLYQEYPIFSLEDPFSEDDFEGFAEITKLLGKNILIVGDDLLATNPQKIAIAQSKNLCNALLLKPNQIGTVTEAIEAGNMAKKAGWKIMVSHRSGETYDDFIADFSVGIGAEYVKFGAPSRGERVAKYNRLLKIEEELLKI